MAGAVSREAMREEALKNMKASGEEENSSKACCRRQPIGVINGEESF
jgi:hypothetical protein